MPEAATHGHLGINSRSHPQVSTSKYTRVSVRAEQWRRVTDKVITIEQAYAVTTTQA